MMRILIVDDHAAIRQSLHHTFEEEPGMQVIAEAVDGYDAIELTRQLQPDIVIMDIQMPRLDGVSATRQITNTWPDIRVIALSTHHSTVYVKAMLAAGASGYVLKDDMLPDLIEAVEAVSAGQSYLSPALSAPVASHNLFASQPAACSNALEPVPSGRLIGS